MAQLQEKLQFDPFDPYPLLNEATYSYEAAKTHSALVDQWLGFPAEELPHDHIGHPESQTWRHLSTQQFQTPYCEIRNILEHIQPKPQETLIDLGCGYGRFAFVLSRHFPSVHFKGFEVDSYRVQIARQRFHFHRLRHAEIFQEDISSAQFQTPLAAYYFLFDFGHTQSILKILEDLKKIAQKQNILVVGRGRATRHFIQDLHPWLSQVNEPHHFPHYSIYKS